MKTQKIPKSLPACADRLQAIAEAMTKVKIQLKTLEEEESAIKQFVVNNLPKSNSTGVAGKKARIQIETKDVPTLSDPGKFYAFIKKSGRFDLLQRRLNNKAVSDTWEAGKTIPGIGVFHAKKVKVVKLKAKEKA